MKHSVTTLITSTFSVLFQMLGIIRGVFVYITVAALGTEVG